MQISYRALAEEIQTETNKIKDDVRDLRRHLHRYPELSWNEFKTSALISQKLRDAGLTVNPEVCKTGVVAELKGRRLGKTVAIRADMDALPMQDAKNVPYASHVPGVMHACGHDCHISMAVGVAQVLQQLGDDFPGTIRFIFQPCEEAAPSGAEELVKLGVMEGVDTIFAFHVDPELPAGRIGLRTGVLTAHCHEFKLTIHGKSGHAARPQQTIDTIFLSNRIMSALYDIVGERSQPFVPAVLTVGKIAGGTKANVIPDLVEIAGTIRTVDPLSNEEIVNAIQDRVKALTSAAGGSYKLEFLGPIPSVVNDAGLVATVRNMVTEIWSADRIAPIERVSMGGEDFSWYLTKAPGALIRLGARKKTGNVTYLHSRDFDIDEQALPFGVSLMSLIARRYLQTQGAES